MNDLQEITAFLTRRGWRVFLEADLDGTCAAGLSQETGMGIEGIPYCKVVGEGATFEAALREAMRIAGIEYKVVTLC